MNREIKFRAWDILNKKMLNWGDIFDLPAWEIFPGTPEQRCYEIMQYTGIKDKNGKEIYEGDILRNKKGEVFKCVWVGCQGAFELSNQKNQYRSIFFANASFKDYEVIGNIYENEEMLKNE